MSTVSEERMRLRIEYSRETNLIFSDNIPAYADWLEKRLAVVSEPCKCGSLNYGYGFAKCYDCGKIKYM
jgi:hypothetical protein